MKNYLGVIKELEKLDKSWNNFKNRYGDLNDSNFQKYISEFLNSYGFQILNSYDHETLKISYIVYFKGHIVDCGLDIGFTNEFWNIVINCFNQINSFSE